MFFFKVHTNSLFHKPLSSNNARVLPIQFLYCRQKYSLPWIQALRNFIMFCWKNCWKTPCRTEEYLHLFFPWWSLIRLVLPISNKLKLFKVQTVDMGIILPEFQLEPLSEIDPLKVIAHMDPVPHGHSFPCAPEMFASMCPHRLYTTYRAKRASHLTERELPESKQWQSWIISHMESVFCWPLNTTRGWMKRVNSYHRIFGSLVLKKVVKSLLLTGFSQQVK